MPLSSLFDEAPGAPLNDIGPLFFAIYPDPEAALRIEGLLAELRARFGVSGDAVKTKNFHTTLFQPGPQSRLTRPERTAALEAGDQLIAESFDVQFDHVVTFPNGSAKPPLALCASDGLPAWRDFQRRLGMAALAVGAVRSQPRYAPHLTLAYDERTFERIEIEPIRWTVRGFALVLSHHGHNYHERLREWVLRETGSGQ